MNSKTFSKSFSKTFSKGVGTGSSLQWTSYLLLLENLLVLTSKNGHKPTDSDLRLQFEVAGRVKISASGATVVH